MTNTDSSKKTWADIARLVGDCNRAVEEMSDGTLVRVFSKSMDGAKEAEEWLALSGVEKERWVKDKVRRKKDRVAAEEMHMRAVWEKKVGIPEIFRSVDSIEWEDTIFVGPAGSGKSYKAAQMVYSLGGNYAVRWVNIPRLLFDIKRDFESGLLEEILGNEYLVLDDLGAEHKTSWVEETVYIIVNDFWENQKHLVVTSNFEVPDIAERFGDSLASRLLDICEVEKMEERDYRLSEN